VGPVIVISSLTQSAFTHPIANLAGREGLEPPTDGFGDRYSTN
jgi:hypothetical protein